MQTFDRYNVGVDCVLLHRTATGNQFVSLIDGRRAEVELDTCALRRPPAALEDHGTTTQLDGRHRHTKSTIPLFTDCPSKALGRPASVDRGPWRRSPWTVGSQRLLSLAAKHRCEKWG